MYEIFSLSFLYNNFLAVIVAISTMIYTIITALMLIENKRSRLQKIEPLIVCYLKSSEDSSSISVIIKNIGEGLAKNVKAILIKDYLRYGKTNLPLSQHGIFINGLSVFPPNYELKYILDLWSNITPLTPDHYIELKVEYFRADNKNRTANYRLNFKEISDQFYSIPPDSYIGKVAHYLEQINKSLKTGKGSTTDS